MASAVTYEGDIQRAEGDSTGLFAGQKLWFSRSVPARYWLMQNAQNNGAQIVQLEQQADVKLVDHAKKNQAPGTYTYRYVDESIRKGILEDLELHRVGSALRVDRPDGSVITASKGSRNRFTDAEDQLLWNWLKPYMDAGGAWKGNEIYKQLEALNPSHTFQSWRDRWIKHTRFQQRRVTEQNIEEQSEIHDQPTDDFRPSKRRKLSEPDPPQPQNASISLVQTEQGPSSNLTAGVSAMGNTVSTSKTTTVEAKHEQLTKQNIEQEVGGEASENDEDLSEVEVEVVAVVDDEASASTSPAETGNQDSNIHTSTGRFPTAYGFTQIEAYTLYSATCHILDARPDKLDESWASVASEHGHTKEEWQTFFYDVILPEYKRRHGLRTTSELEAHYQSEVRRRGEEEEEEERKMRESALKKQLDSHSELANAEQGDPAQLQTQSTEDTRTDHGQPETTSNELQSMRQQDDGVNVQSPERGQGIHNARTLSQPNSVVDYRPPRPNESRKLSQTRGSQSSSSQSQPQSQSQSQQNRISMSQQSQISHEVLPVSQMSENTDIAKLFQSSSAETTQSTHSPLLTGIRDNLQSQRLAGNKLGHNSDAVDPVSTLQYSEDYDPHSSRFVTQISTDEHDVSPASDAELEDIPFRPPTPSWPGGQASSPLFIPEASQKVHPIVQNQTDPASSPMPVLLVDDEEVESESDQSVEYAPSEAPSEAIQFESHAILSQAWETAPDQNTEVHKPEIAEMTSDPVINQDSIGAQEEVSHASDESSTDTDTGYNTARRSRESSIQLHNSETREKSRTEMSTEEEFETAPTEINRHFVQHQAEHTNKQLDTQALFQQPTQNNLAEIAAIPEPPGGWDDEEQNTVRIPTHDVVTESAPSNEADWTLPLPDLDLDLEDAPPPPSKDADSVDIDDWLSFQPKLYPSIPSQLLNPFSHHALESTSMDISLATVVLEQMVQRFMKGEHSFSLTTSAIRKLPKRERKTTIMKIADELTPSDTKGCWTRNDDKSLLGDNGREVKRVEDKHGVDFVKTRFEFLELWHSF